MRTRICPYILLAFSVLVLGCGGAEKKRSYKLPGQTDYRVEEVVLKGVESVDDDEIIEGLVTKEDPGWRGDISEFPILGAERKYFNYVEWERDLQRILTYYKERGYFDVRIVSKNIIQDDKTKTVRLSVTIREGEPTGFTAIDVLGLDGTDIDVESLKNDLPISVGTKFSQARYLAAKNAITLSLKRRSYAYAQVKGRVTVDPQDRIAEVLLFVDPGPKCFFGKVTVEGLEDVDEKYIRTAVAFKEGDPYDPDLVDETQEDIYDLRAFSVVKVLTQREMMELEGSEQEEDSAPDEDAEEETLGISSILDQAQDSAEKRSELDPVVPFVIRVKEAKSWNLRVGVAGEVEINRMSFSGRADWSNPNFFGGLQRVEHLNSVGYAWAPTFFDPINDGVILDSDLRYTKPQFFERLTNLKGRLRFEREVYQGYEQNTPSFRIGLAREFFNHLLIDISYNLSLNILTNVDESLIDSDVFVEDYRLEYLEQLIRLDFRDDALNPRFGFMLETIFQEASSYFGLGQRDYFKVIVGAETYFPLDLGVPHTLGFRARLGSIYAVGAGKDVPVSEKLYGGGSNSLRSFGRQEVSYFTSSGRAIPIGALTKLDLSVESRWRISRNALDVGDLWFVGFFDMSSVSDRQFTFDTPANNRGTVEIGTLFDTLLYGVGGGLFWETPIGPIRFDFAYTLSDITNDERFRRCTNGETTCDSSLWVPVDEDPIQDRIAGYNFYIGIGHSF